MPLPEMPEVETIKIIIEPQIKGQTILSVLVGNPQIIAYPDETTLKILNTAGIPMMSIDFWRYWADTGKIAVKGYTRSDDTPLHKAVREACVNMVIHADYMLTGTLKVIKTVDGFEITNPRVLKIPKEQIYQDGNSPRQEIQEFNPCCAWWGTEIMWSPASLRY